MVLRSRSKARVKASTPVAGGQSVDALKARIVGAGYTITRFAREKGFSRSTVKAAIRGERAGKQSQAVLAAIWSLPLPR